MQAEEDALVEKVEARIRYALGQTLHPADTRPLGFMPLPKTFENDVATGTDGLMLKSAGAVLFTSTFLQMHARS